MSKELIEKLRDYAGMAETNSVAQVMLEAADALEAKASPVGELREAFEAEIAALIKDGADIARKADGEYRNFYLQCAWQGFQAGAAYQRAQQPQSAEAVNRAHVMDALLMWNRRHEIPPIKIGYEYGVAGAVLDLVATPQPSAGVVMPDVDDLANFIRYTDGSHKMGAGALAERIVDWLSAPDARLNGKEVGRG